MSQDLLPPKYLFNSSAFYMQNLQFYQQYVVVSDFYSCTINCPENQWLEITNIYYLTVSMGQESESKLAECFWCRVSPEVAVRMSARVSHLKARLGLKDPLPCWQEASVSCSLFKETQTLTTQISPQSCLSVLTIWQLTSLQCFKTDSKEETTMPFYDILLDITIASAPFY